MRQNAHSAGRLCLCKERDFMKIKDNNLYADEGMVLVKGNVRAVAVYLASGADASDWSEMRADECEVEGDVF